MKTVPLAITVILTVGTEVSAQNLVPNASFEEYTECPDLGTQIERALGWSSYRGSPDYFNACDVVSYVGVPNNFAGGQFAAQGNGYAGVIAWSTTPNDREHLGIRLESPLVPNVPVYLSMKVVPATNGDQQDHRYSVNGLGLLFTTQAYSHNNSNPLPDHAAIHFTIAPIDTANWSFITGMYIPDSAYEYVVLGGFFEDDLVDPIVVDPNGDIQRAYMFVDDVCVSIDPTTCSMEQAIIDPDNIGPQVFPNPFSALLTVQLGGFDTSSEVLVHDETGRILLSFPITPGQTNLAINGTDLPQGLLIVSYRTSTGVLRRNCVVHLSP